MSINYTYKDKTYQFENLEKEELENIINNFETLKNSMKNIMRNCLYDDLDRIPDHYDTLEFHVNYDDNLDVTFKLRKTKTSINGLYYHPAQILDSFKAFQIIIAKKEYDLQAYSLYGKFYNIREDYLKKTVLNAKDFEPAYFIKPFINSLNKMDEYNFLPILKDDNIFSKLNNTKRTYTVDNEKYPSVFKINCFDK